MEHLIPHFILNKYADGETSGHFQSASLFVDLSGFTAVTNALMEYGSEAAEGGGPMSC